MEDENEKMAREFEEHIAREEMIWEVWLRVLMHQVMPDRDAYHNWLIARALRSDEERYGAPKE